MSMFRTICVFQILRVRPGPYGYIKVPIWSDSTRKVWPLAEYMQIRCCLYWHMEQIQVEPEVFCLIPIKPVLGVLGTDSIKPSSGHLLFFILVGSFFLRGILFSDLFHIVDRVKRIWYLSPMRAAKVQASLRNRAGSPEPSLFAYTSSESRGTFR